jgi:hypothetical protein
MPTQFQWWISQEDGSELTGPFLTKDLAITGAVLNGIFSEEENDQISIFALEATSRTIEDITINAENVLDDLETFYSDCGDGIFKDISCEDAHMLEKALNEAFQMWARDRDILRIGLFLETRNEETVTMPKPDHAKKITEE